MLQRRRLTGTLAGLAGTAAFAAWFTSPLWTSPGRVFAGLLSTDNIVTPWFYDFVARQLAAGDPIETMSDFDWPVPLDRMREFPDIADAALAAPLAWWLDWPAQWGATLTLAVTLNGLGLAALAAACGLRGLGVLTAGVMGVMMRPVWTDIVMGRLNVTFIGLVAMAMAATLWSMPARTPGQRGAAGRLVAACAAAGLGALAALIYPPFVLMLAPAGLVLAAGPLRKSGLLGAALPLLAVAGGAWLASDELLAIYSSQDRSPGCSTCPDAYNAVALRDLARWAVEPRQGLSYSGLAGPAWLLAPLALLHPRRKAAAALLAMVALSAVLALGPCPRLTPTEDVPRAWVEQAWPHLGALWCASAPLHDYGRFATVAAVLLALLSAMGADALGRRRGWLAPLLGTGLAAAVSFQAGTLVMGEILDPRKWHTPAPPATAIFLRDAAPGPAVELPFDRSEQFLSVLYAPASPRVNPVRPTPHPVTHDPAIVWLFELGWGRVPEEDISAEQLRETGLRWVLYDTSRCAPQGRRDPCPAETLSTLRRVLGAPVGHGDDLLVWELSPPP